MEKENERPKTAISVLRGQTVWCDGISHFIGRNRWPCSCPRLPFTDSKKERKQYELFPA